MNNMGMFIIQKEMVIKSCFVPRFIVAGFTNCITGGATIVASFTNCMIDGATADARVLKKIYVDH